MKNFVIIFLFVIFVQNANSIKVSIFYEALCPDSTNFIARQLYPNYRNLKDYMEIEFIPFGKAIQNFENNKWSFDCQHGPKECQGNKYQSCALVQNITEAQKVNFVYCVMKERNPANVKKIESCSARYQINWTKVSNCARTIIGDAVLANNGNKTYSVEPNIAFVPTIIFDQQFDQVLQDQALTNFAAVVCSKIIKKKPSFCDNKILPKKEVFFWDY